MIKGVFTSGAARPSLDVIHVSVTRRNSRDRRVSRVPSQMSDKETAPLSCKLQKQERWGSEGWLPRAMEPP